MIFKTKDPIQLVGSPIWFHTWRHVWCVVASPIRRSLRIPRPHPQA